MRTRRKFIVVLVVASLALGACTRERQTGTPTSDAIEKEDPARSSAHTIVIVPASDELLSRAAAGGVTIRKILAAGLEAGPQSYAVWFRDGFPLS